MGSGGGKDDGVNWNEESLGLIEKGLKGAIDELKASGSSATSSLQGAGFEELSLTGMEAGDGGVAVDFEDFCEKWEWGVRALVQNANGLAERLGLSAGMAYEEDQYAAGALKVGLNSILVTGNPHATEEEITKQGWGDIVKPDAPDWSGESWDKAGEDIKQDWKDTGRELTTKGRGGMYMDMAQRASGMSDEQIEAERDEWFGPSPEERAAAQQQQGGQG
ncbi:hypothetical protein ACH4RA_00350 [Streptomyces smyrnaeus]|uniref:hypothetical protein n=1 Tax=Streptomyces TaxID=1883 RepID=UPI000C1795C2|nr:hypothetical protein [Streptomyces sp. B15]MBQ1119313.1 hypothetical protein [Streptomyces sp. B15]MBQ1159901.1 hypothetical protein [Streptomyces sp. A73]